MPGVEADPIAAIYRKTGDDARKQRAKLQAELDEINAEREARVVAIRKLDKLLTFIDGPKPKPKPRTPRAGSGQGKPGASLERQDGLAEWLRKNVNGNEFNAPDLLLRDDFNKAMEMTSTYLAGALAKLHERGVVRLVKTGHPQHGNRTKIWRLTQ